MVLAERAAAHVALDDPNSVGRLLTFLREVAADRCPTTPPTTAGRPTAPPPPASRSTSTSYATPTPPNSK
jgi:hypothetical protein